jgi:tRNA modification GTPase
MTPGTVINIPAEVKHWHGAAPDSWFSHLAIEVAGEETSNEWLEEVSDEEGCASLRPGLESLLKELDSSIDERSSHLLYDGLHVTLFGRPNGGKSSLLNLLTGEDRAIVTSIPGTTRDVLEGSILLDGIQIHLTDTAGLRSTEDPIERIGVARSKKAIEQADIRILILDGSETLSQEDEKHLLSLEEKDAVVINKSDLPQCIDPEEIKGIFLKRVSNAAPQILSVSALDEASLFPLKEFLRQSGAIRSGLSVTSPRHLSALRSASKHLHDALLSLEAHCPPDLISIDLQSAQSTLCEITGETAGEKLLDRVFSSFCVGK